MLSRNFRSIIHPTAGQRAFFVAVAVSRGSSAQGRAGCSPGGGFFPAGLADARRIRRLDAYGPRDDGAGRRRSLKIIGLIVPAQ